MFCKLNIKVNKCIKFDRNPLKYYKSCIFTVLTDVEKL